MGFVPYYTKRRQQNAHQRTNEHKVSHALDWHFNKVFEELGFNVYWGKAITSHGSVMAMYDEDKKGLKSVLRNSY